MKKLFLPFVLLLLCCAVFSAFAAETDGTLYGEAYVAANEQTLLSFVKDNLTTDAPGHDLLKLSRSVLLPDLTEPAEVEYGLSYISDTEHVQFWFQPHDWEPVKFFMELLPDGKATFYHVVYGSSSVTRNRADLKPDEVLSFAHRGAVKVTIPWPMDQTETFVGWDALIYQCVGLHLYDFGFYGLCPDHKLLPAPGVGAQDMLQCSRCHMQTQEILWDEAYYKANEESLIAYLNNLIKEEESFPSQLLKTVRLTNARFNVTLNATCALMLNDRRDGVLFRMTNSSNDTVCELLLMPGLKAELRFLNLSPDSAGKTSWQMQKTREAFPKPGVVVVHDTKFNLYASIYCLPDVMNIWTSLLKDACGMELYQLGFTCFCRTHKLELYQADEPVCEGTWTEYFRCETCRKYSPSTHTGSHVFGEPVVTKKVSCFKDGQKTQTCSRCGYQIKTVLPAPNEHMWWETTVAATTKRDGYIHDECDRCHTVNNHVVIPRIASVTLSATEYTFNGKARSPKVTVTDRTGKAVARGNYKVAYPQGRKQPGVYAVTVKMAGESYAGTFTRKFRILPAKAGGLAVQGKTLRWKPVSSAQKYIVYYRPGNTGDFKKLCTATKPSCSLSKLQSGKLYSFTVRTYYRDAAAKTTLLGNPSATLKVQLK